MPQITEHFDSSEFACRHCGELPPDEDALRSLSTALEKLRALLGGRPMTITSAYRCPVHNEEIGGAPDSQHMGGIAADVMVEGCSGREMYDAAVQIPEINGLGVDDYMDYLHVDLREEDAAAKWCYDFTGSSCTWSDLPLDETTPAPWAEPTEPQADQAE